MDSFKVQWKNAAKKELKKLDKPSILKILTVVESLAETLYPHGVKKIQGMEQAYRIRVGDYRIVYTVETSVLLIEIIRVRHRKEIYKKITI